MIGGVVAIISRNGGMAGVVKKLAPLAKGPKSTQLVTWLLGVAIFFDDYANSLIVGNTMRPLTDKYKISRENLAYIVDSTAAPISAVAFITTWIGAELNYISDALPMLSGLDNPPSAY
jgi:Na+/H+ antiporter NhaC